MISNATPLICLSRINRLLLLKETFGVITIPLAVKQEVLIEGKPGVSLILDALQQDWIKVVGHTALFKLNLGKGETAAIALAKEQGDTVVLDDAQAIAAAKVYGVPVIRTTTILMMALSKKVITRPEAITILNELVNTGYYIGPREYARLFAALSEGKATSKSQRG